MGTYFEFNIFKHVLIYVEIPWDTHIPSNLLPLIHQSYPFMVHTPLQVFIRIPLSILPYFHTYTNIHICSCLHTYREIYFYTYTFTYLYIHFYLLTYIPTYIHNPCIIIYIWIYILAQVHNSSLLQPSFSHEKPKSFTISMKHLLILVP